MLYLANINKDLFKTKFKDNKIEVKIIFISAVVLIGNKKI